MNGLSTQLSFYFRTHENVNDYSFVSNIPFIVAYSVSLWGGEYSCPQKCDDVSTGKYLPAFRKDVVPSSLRPSGLD
jgi:hypothetical protein